MEKSSRWENILSSLGFGSRKKQGKVVDSRRRTLHIEPLEERQLLTVLTWDPDLSNNGVFGGTGNWMTADAWVDTATSTRYTWSSGNEAVFKGTAGTVTIDTTGIIAAKLTFQDVDGYVLAGSNPLAITGSGVSIAANQSATISANIAAATTQQWDVASSKTLSVSSVVSGTDMLLKDGTGTLTLSGTNTYTGGTTINAGTLAFANGGLSTTGNIVFGGNSTLKWADGNAQDISARLRINNGVNATLDTGNNTVFLTTGFGLTSTGTTSTGGITVKTSPSQLLNLVGTNTYTGGTTINTGILAFCNGGLGNTGNITFSGNSAIVWWWGNTRDISGRLRINDGVNATLDTGNNINVVRLETGLGLTSAETTSTGSITKSGNGTLELAGVSTYTGGTTISGGTLAFASGGLGTTGNIVFGGNSTLKWVDGNTQDISARLRINNGVNATLDTSSNSLTFATAFGASGSGALTKKGSGSLTLSGANTYTGGTTINDGCLSLSCDNGLAPTGDIMIAGGSLYLDQHTLTISGDMTFQSGTLEYGTIIKSGADYAFQSTSADDFFLTDCVTLAGNVGATKTGDGYVFIDPTSFDFTGSTSINGGVLDGEWLTCSSSSTAVVYVNNTGTLSGSVNTDINRPVSVTSGGTLWSWYGRLEVGYATGTGVTFSSGSTLMTGIYSSSSYDSLGVEGTVSLGGSTLSIDGTYVPISGDSFTIIENDGTDAVVGQFSCGTTITVNGVAMTINYAGGDGNDVVLTRA